MEYGLGFLFLFGLGIMEVILVYENWEYLSIFIKKYSKIKSNEC